MKSLFIGIAMLSFVHLGFASEMYHHTIDTDQQMTEYQVENVKPFSELIVSWNAFRPLEGEYAIYVSLKMDDWSLWLLYASWGSHGQKSFSEKLLDFPIQVYQDTVETQGQAKATGFKVRVEALEGANLKQFHSLHACAADVQSWTSPQQLQKELFSVYLPLSGLSQIALQHPRHKDMCSPTSTAAVVNYLSESHAADPLEFAQHAYDKGFDIYGNWVFNVAQAYTYLSRPCWVTRLSSFEDIHDRLSKGKPVIISIRGPLKGSALPYKSGHLIAIIGYDSERNVVQCMDPAFPLDRETLVSYPMDDLMSAWGRRKNIAYIFN
jgi:Peptidase_C39 like family